MQGSARASAYLGPRHPQPDVRRRLEVVVEVMADFGQTDFGQTNFGQPFDRLWPIVGLTDFGQTDFGQF